MDIVRKHSLWGQFHSRLQSSSEQAARYLPWTKSGTNLCSSCKEQVAESVATVGTDALGRCLQKSMFHTGGHTWRPRCEGQAAPSHKAKAGKVSADFWQEGKEILAQKPKLAQPCLGSSRREEDGKEEGDYMFFWGRKVQTRVWVKDQELSFSHRLRTCDMLGQKNINSLLRISPTAANIMY